MMLERLLGAAGFQLETKLANATRPSELLDLNRDRVLDVLSRYPVRQAWVFGSVARGDDRPDSDLDLLVDLAAEATPVDAVELQEELAAALGCAVDVVTTKEMESNELFRRRVQRDLRRLGTAA
jgi:predicted nucleotidyltransferase